LPTLSWFSAAPHLKEQVGAYILELMDKMCPLKGQNVSCDGTHYVLYDVFGKKQSPKKYVWLRKVEDFTDKID